MPTLLQSSTILLRPHEPQDVDPLFEAVLESIAEISPWLPWCHAAFSKSELASFIEISRNGWKDGSQYQFVILDAVTNLALGGISLNHIARSNRLANMGYWVRTSATGRGVASAAVKLVATYGFRELGLTRIEIAAMPENSASRRVAERAGAKFEAVARNRLVMHGRAYDAALYALVPGDIEVAT
jgi:ribosomal-protein-serine acetyltransferase